MIKIIKTILLKMETEDPRDDLAFRTKRAIERDRDKSLKGEALNIKAGS